MSCFGCARPLKKELGCASCGFAFCAKCLPFKALIAAKDPVRPLPICAQCNRKLTTTTTNPVIGGPPSVSPIDPPAHHFLTGHNLPPPSMRSQKNYAHQSFVPKGTNQQRAYSVVGQGTSPQPTAAPDLIDFSGMSEADKELHMRLSKLKEGKKDPTVGGNVVPSEDEMVARLARLRGVDPETIRNPSSPPPTTEEQKADLLTKTQAEVDLDNRLAGGNAGAASKPASFTSDAQTSEDMAVRLLQETAAEAERDAELALDSLQKDEQIKARLDELRKDAIMRNRQSMEISDALAGEKGKMGEGYEGEEKVDDALVDRTTKEILAEMKLEDELDEAAIGIVSKPKPESSTAAPSAAKEEGNRELWCCICAEDAELSCHGCDDDMYCRRCYREGHDREDLKEHRWKSIKHP